MINYLEIAHKIVELKYPSCDGALMAGSIVRGEGTETSDIDLIIYNSCIHKGYRESFVFEGVPIEAFVHNEASFKHYFKEDCDRKMPSLPVMVHEAVDIRQNDFLDALRKEATNLISKGPGKPSERTVDTMRYFITDLKEDLVGSTDDFETLLIANELVVKLHEFYLLTHNAWIGKSKWIKRAMYKHDPKFAEAFEKQILSFYTSRDKAVLIKLIDQMLSPFGGDYFDGFTVGK